MNISNPAAVILIVTLWGCDREAIECPPDVLIAHEPPADTSDHPRPLVSGNPVLSCSSSGHMAANISSKNIYSGAQEFFSNACHVKASLSRTNYYEREGNRLVIEAFDQVGTRVIELVFYDFSSPWPLLRSDTIYKGVGWEYPDRWTDYRYDDFIYEYHIRLTPEAYWPHSKHLHIRSRLTGITEFDAAANTVSGTFNFSCGDPDAKAGSEGAVYVKEGVFNRIQMVVIPP